MPYPEMAAWTIVYIKMTGKSHKLEQLRVIPVTVEYVFVPIQAILRREIEISKDPSVKKDLSAFLVFLDGVVAKLARATSSMLEKPKVVEALTTLVEPEVNATDALLKRVEEMLAMLDMEKARREFPKSEKVAPKITNPFLAPETGEEHIYEELKFVQDRAAEYLRMNPALPRAKTPGKWLVYEQTGFEKDE